MTKFLALVADQALYLCRADGFEDQWEGFVTALPEEDRLKRMEHRSPEGLVTLTRHFLKFQADIRTQIFASCWHAEDDETAQMWEIYSARSSGLAVRSIVGMLKAAVAASSLPLLIGRVEYEKTLHPEQLLPDSVLVPFFAKMKEYRLEREVREVLWARSPVIDDCPDFNAGPKGYSYPIDLAALIDRVVISPRARHIEKLIRSVLDQYGHREIPVHLSRMTDSPPSLAEWKLKEPRIYSLNVDLSAAGMEKLLRACHEYNQKYPVLAGPEFTFSAIQTAAKAAGFDRTEDFIPNP